jgi:hypothetical protein
MQQLKQKLKAGKRPKNAGWSESLTKGETEIVIPNKKFKGSVKLQPAQTPEAATPEVILAYNFVKILLSLPFASSVQNPKLNTSNNSGNRRVNFVLNKNTAQGKSHRACSKK